MSSYFTLCLDLVLNPREWEGDGVRSCQAFLKVSYLFVPNTVPIKWLLIIMRQRKQEREQKREAPLPDEARCQGKTARGALYVQ